MLRGILFICFLLLEGGRLVQCACLILNLFKLGVCFDVPVGQLLEQEADLGAEGAKDVDAEGNNRNVCHVFFAVFG